MSRSSTRPDGAMTAALLASSRRYSRTRLRASVSGLALLAGLLGAGGASQAQTIDRYVMIQPIIVCDDAGNNCTSTDAIFKPEMEAIYRQANTINIILPANQINSTSLLNQQTGADGFNGPNTGQNANP